MERLELAQQLLHLQGRPLAFGGRPYLHAVYACDAPRIVLRTGRQCEKSTTVAVLAVLEALTSPEARILIVLPRDEQLRTFRDQNLLPLLEHSPCVRPFLRGRGTQRRAHFLRLANGAQIFLRSAYHTSDATRGIAGSYLALDEAQDLPGDVLSVAEQCLSHAQVKRIVVSGTPKTNECLLEQLYWRTSRAEWEMTCAHCGHANVPGLESLAPEGLHCARCRRPLDVLSGRWAAREPRARWGMGFWWNTTLGPWASAEEIESWRESYPPARFVNEVLGLPSEAGDHVVTRAQTEACCAERGPITDRATLLQIPGLVEDTAVLGIDWSGGETSQTALVAGAFDERGTYHVLLLERLPAGDDFRPALERARTLALQLCLTQVAADARGNGSVLNRQLLAQLTAQNDQTSLWGIVYVTSGQAPRVGGDHRNRWSLERTGAIGAVMTAIQTRRLTFPRLADCRAELEEIWREQAVFDRQQRTIRYECPSAFQDDILHALTCAHAVSRYIYSRIFAQPA